MPERTEDRIISLGESDSKLWKRFKSGDRDAFSIIYNSYIAALYNYGLKITSHRELVRDSVQDLFIELWKNRETIGETTVIKYYLYKCIRRKLIRNIERSSKHVSTTEFNPEQGHYSVSSEEEILIGKQTSDQQKQYLSKALSKLTNRQREALFLKYYDSLSNTEIATIMAVNEQSVYNLVHQGLQLLKKYFPLEILLLALFLFL